METNTQPNLIDEIITETLYKLIALNTIKFLTTELRTEKVYLEQVLQALVSVTQIKNVDKVFNRDTIK